MKKNVLNITIILSVLISSSSFTFIKKWYLLEAEHFSITFPKDPIFESRDVPSINGPLQTNSFIYNSSDDYKKDENLFYMLVQTTYPPNVINSNDTAVLDEIFKTTIQSTAKSIQGKVTKINHIKKNEFPGKEIKIVYEGGKMVANCQLFLARNQLFVLQTICKIKNDDNESHQKFISSFQLRL